MFAGAHPLAFLAIGRRLYRAMTAETGWPNRILPPAYRDFLARHGWPARTGITWLAAPFRDIADADLAVAGFVRVAGSP